MAEKLHAPLAVADAWAEIDRQRLGLADLLDTLTDAEWETPSLCSGWRVRDVAAHLALAQTGPWRATADLVRARGRFDVMIRDSARRHAAARTAELAEQIRSMAGSRRKAPGVSHLEPLVDVLVHGQDIAVPLGRARVMPIEAAAAAARRVETMPWPLSTAFHVRALLRGIRLEADDVDWSAGEGALVRGPIQSLLMLLTGRPAPSGSLAGPGVELVSRVSWEDHSGGPSAHDQQIRGRAGRRQFDDDSESGDFQ